MVLNIFVLFLVVSLKASEGLTFIHLRGRHSEQQQQLIFITYLGTSTTDRARRIASQISQLFFSPLIFLARPRLLAPLLASKLSLTSGQSRVTAAHVVVKPRAIA